jgi:gamma-glutamylcyclotransferase (GGCT)/AIG2-like uncharacterized protein YtfP
MARVAGCRLASVPARLAGYRRTLVRDEEYPGIAEAAGHEVDGVLYLDAPEEAIRRLDAFEGVMYDRREVLITTAGGEDRTVMTYVFRPEYRFRLTDITWDYQRFLDSGKERFVNGYFGFDVVP